MPLLMAQWLPLMREALRNPASSPSSAPPGKTSFGSDCRPPAVTARVALGLHFPQLLQPDAVDLRIGVPLQGVLREQLPAQMPARALGEEGVFRVQLHPGLVGRGLLAAAADAELAGGDALYARA